VVKTQDLVSLKKAMGNKGTILEQDNKILYEVCGYYTTSEDMLGLYLDVDGDVNISLVN
jgi:hypothetical protein